MVQIALWPRNVMNTLRSLFKERYTVRTERQTDALLIFSASPTVYKNVPEMGFCLAAKKRSAMHTVCGTVSAVLRHVLFAMCGLSNLQIYAIPSLENLYRSYR